MNEPIKSRFPVSEDGVCGIETTRDAVIDRYMAGEMPEAEEEDFLDHILFCDACNVEVRFRRDMLTALQGEPVSEPYRQRAQAIYDRRAGKTVPLSSSFPALQSFWLKAAAIFLGLVTVFYSLYYAASPTPSPWAQIALIHPDDYNPQFLQNTDNNQWQAYNDGLRLLVAAQQKEWLRPGISFNEAKVHQAIETLQGIDTSTYPEARRMDVAYYLCKANLMINNPAEAIRWLETAKDIGVNKAKIMRALTLCEQFLAVLNAALSSESNPAQLQKLRLWQQQLKTIQATLQAIQ